MKSPVDRVPAPEAYRYEDETTPAVMPKIRFKYLDRIVNSRRQKQGDRAGV